MLVPVPDAACYLAYLQVTRTVGMLSSKPRGWKLHAARVVRNPSAVNAENLKDTVQRRVELKR
jgi:hypothetical protein